MDKVKIIYNNKYGFITFKRESIEVSAILIAYDSAIKVIDFEDGLLTILMRRGNKEVEEYVDFSYILSMIGISNKKHEYFSDVKKDDIELEMVA